MVNVTRRVLAALAVTLAGLGVRRAAARPARVRIEPVLSKLPPAEPVPAPAPVEVSASGWWVEGGGSRGGGWIYSPNIGWMHCFRLPPNLTLAAWYGPPPPRPVPEPIDWGLFPNEEIKALIAGPLPLRGIHR